MIVWLDCASGVSGDKLLAALIDAGGPACETSVRKALAALPLDGWALAFERAARGGVEGATVRVDAAAIQPHRAWSDVRAMLGTAALPATVRALSLQAFGLLADAEARVHGVEPGEVRFHEVGAVDSLVDTVGACAAYAALGSPEIVCSPVALGGGTVTCAHGALPVPAPATALLLEGVPAYGGDTSLGELTTPTGAALVRTLATSFGPMPPMTVGAVGHGAGSREVEGLPNVLRAVTGEPLPDEAGDEDVVVLETCIDHLAPELLAIALDAVLAAGALDVWQAPVVMKKGRAAVQATVLCAPADEERLAALLIAQTGTLGVRRRAQRRWVAERESAEVATAAGRVRVKRGAGLARPEADDVARACRETGEAPAAVARRLADAADDCGAAGARGPQPATE